MHWSYVFLALIHRYIVSFIQLLARLLKSKHPEDLQAANRLIKNMVKQDAERMDRKSKRMQELETVNNNVKLLNEMLQHYSTTTATEADTDIMKVGSRGYRSWTVLSAFNSLILGI